MKKRSHRRPIEAKPPAGLRPKLTADQRIDLSLAHHENLDDIANGKGTVETMWHLVEQVYTWHYIAEQMKAGVPEMAAQLEMATRVVERFGRTGRVGFSGLEYQVAKEGVAVMDQLAELTEKDVALAAVVFSEAIVDMLEAKHRAGNVPAVITRDIAAKAVA